MTDIDTPQSVKDLPPGAVVGAGDIVEAAGHPVGGGLIKPGYDPRLTNEDLAPLRTQHWSSYNIFAFWMSDVHSVGGGYVTAGSLFALGLASWQVLIALLIGIVIVNIFCNLVAKPSQATGVPYPVICRSVFGVLGANIPAIIRGLIAVAWYGIQTYLASAALDVVLLKLFFPDLRRTPTSTSTDFSGYRSSAGGSFLLLWVLQACVFWRGMESIRKFIDFCGPAVYVVMFMLCGYLIYKAGWGGAIDLNLGDVKYTGLDAVPVMLGAIALVVSYFSGPMLNFGDFARYGKSFAAVKRGQLSRTAGELPGLLHPGGGHRLAHGAGLRGADHRSCRDRGQDRLHLRNRAGSVDLHHRHHRYQHRRKLHLAGFF